MVYIIYTHCISHLLSILSSIEFIGAAENCAPLFIRIHHRTEADERDRQHERGGGGFTAIGLAVSSILAISSAARRVLVREGEHVVLQEIHVTRTVDNV